MITTLLEKLILNNKAQFSVHNHSYSSYGRIPIAEGKLVVLTGFVWHHFFNPYLDDGITTTINSITSSSLEWQMKIESEKSKAYFIFKNGWWFANADTIVPDSQAQDLIAAVPTPIYFAAPEQRELYMVCTGFISITITRNTCRGQSGASSVVGVLNAKANEEPTPNGVGNIALQLRTRFQTWNSGSTNQQYIPAGIEPAGVTGTDRTAQSYMQDVGVESIIQPNYSGLYNQLPATQTQPLVEFHLVTVNSNEYANMINN